MAIDNCPFVFFFCSLFVCLSEPTPTAYSNFNFPGTTSTSWLGRTVCVIITSFFCFFVFTTVNLENYEKIN
ncbi:hypothetical protein BCR41DRAFT_362520 [Lobosporangium transversale]|uniref:Uncharacterized protein n=1 Tax=Lobosporangium transversale TaxID=64571 RepID=A0A1Y2G990_9FUNG|nr:hypothetical protein BCR41DRAFT_362520 [Lobosporangium transversale]ORZ04692.1 hypothetical protein BCR41DRAFT_362520 [Lobosporangium transversale]|eukprot:XP_021876689.1 hypothetical protein BCR41DRAFT_362520 [Lobosporangium transversale]